MAEQNSNITTDGPAARRLRDLHRMGTMARESLTPKRTSSIQAILNNNLDAPSDPEERLQDLESVARAAWDAGEKNLYDWYSAISRIRDEKLFQSKYKSFEAYLRDNWYDRVSRARVWQLISMQRVLEAFTPETQYPALPEANSVLQEPAPVPEIKTVHNVDYFEMETSSTKQTLEPPKTEAQARVLAPLLKEPEVIKEVWKQAQDESGVSQPSAAAIRDVIGRRDNVIEINGFHTPTVVKPIIVSELDRLRAALLKHHTGWDSKETICKTCGETR